MQSPASSSSSAYESLVRDVFVTFDSFASALFRRLFRRIFGEQLVLGLGLAAARCTASETPFPPRAQQLMIEQICVPLLSLDENPSDERIASGEAALQMLEVLQHYFSLCGSSTVSSPSSSSSEDSNFEQKKNEWYNVVVKVLVPILRSSSEENKENQRDSASLAILALLQGQYDPKQQDVDLKNQIDWYTRSRPSLSVLRSVLACYCASLVPRLQHTMLMNLANIMPIFESIVRTFICRAFFYPELQSINEKKRQLAQQVLEANKQDLPPFFHLEPIRFLTNEISQKNSATLSLSVAESIQQISFRVLRDLLDRCLTAMMTEEGLAACVKGLRQVYRFLESKDLSSLVDESPQVLKNQRASLLPHHAVFVAEQLIIIAQHTEILSYSEYALDIVLQCVRILSSLSYHLEDRQVKQKALQLVSNAALSAAKKPSQKAHKVLLALGSMVCDVFIASRHNDMLFVDKSSFRTVVCEGILRPLVLDSLQQALESTNGRSTNAQITHLIEVSSSTVLRLSRACERLAIRLADENTAARSMSQSLHSAAGAQQANSHITYRLDRFKLNALLRYMMLGMYMLSRLDAVVVSAYALASAPQPLAAASQRIQSLLEIERAAIALLFQRESTQHIVSLLDKKNTNLFAAMFGQESEPASEIIDTNTAENTLLNA